MQARVHFFYNNVCFFFIFHFSFFIFLSHKGTINFIFHFSLAYMQKKVYFCRKF